MRDRPWLVRVLTILASALAFGVSVPGSAQMPGCPVAGIQCVILQSWTPTTAPVQIVATSVSSTYTLPASGPTLTVLVRNLTASTGFITLGASSAVAVPGPPSVPIPGYGSVWLSIGYNTTLASIVVSSAATLEVTIGTGAPLLVNSVIPPAQPPLPLTYITSASASVGTSSGQIAAAGVYTRTFQVCTLPTATTNVWINSTGAAAVVGSGIPVYFGGGCAFFGPNGLPVPTAAITAITDGGIAQTVSITGG